MVAKCKRLRWIGLVTRIVEIRTQSFVGKRFGKQHFEDRGAGRITLM